MYLPDFNMEAQSVMAWARLTAVTLTAVTGEPITSTWPGTYIRFMRFMFMFTPPEE
jgi:hypothetical protein